MNTVLFVNATVGFSENLFFSYCISFCVCYVILYSFQNTLLNFLIQYFIAKYDSTVIKMTIQKPHQA